MRITHLGIKKLFNDFDYDFNIEGNQNVFILTGPVYKDAPAYVNGVSESLFRTGLCLPSGPCVTDDDVRYIVGNIKAAILD